MSDDFWMNEIAKRTYLNEGIFGGPTGQDNGLCLSDEMCLDELNVLVIKFRDMSELNLIGFQQGRATIKFGFESEVATELFVSDGILRWDGESYERYEPRTLAGTWPMSSETAFAGTRYSSRIQRIDDIVSVIYHSFSSSSYYWP